MSYTTTYLKADNYDDFVSACSDAGLIDDEGNTITVSHNHCLVLLGVLHKPTGNVIKDDDGNEIPETTLLEGYHANLRAKVPVGIEHLAVECATPLVVFA